MQCHKSMLCHTMASWIVWMVKMDVLVVLLNPGVSQVTCLPYIDLTIFKRDAEYPFVFSSRLSLIGIGKLEIFLGERLMVLMCQNSILVLVVLPEFDIERLFIVHKSLTRVSSLRS